MGETELPWFPPRFPVERHGGAPEAGRDPKKLQVRQSFAHKESAREPSTSSAFGR